MTMKKRFSKKGMIQILLIAVATSFLFVGCGEGEEAKVLINANPIENAQALTAEITEVTIPNGGSTGGAPRVSFKLTDQNGNGVTGLSDGRFIIAKLTETANGRTNWQSYINSLETHEDGDDGTTAVGTTAIQATYERPATEEREGGVLTDHGDGSYTYVFLADLSSISLPTLVQGQAAVPDVTYEPTLTHRVAMQIEGNEGVVANPYYDFQPSTGKTEGITTRNIVVVASCNECHGKLALHGGGRIEVEYCVTCHNPGTVDAHSGNNLDMKTMTHKIHRGENLPSIEEGVGSYIIWGHNNSEHDYSTVVYPQDIRHCTKCHDPADEETPDAGNYTQHPSMEACGACHDNIVFDGSTPAAWQEEHPGGVVTNGDCSNCHGGIGSDVDISIAGKHSIAAELAAATIEYHIISVTNTAPGQLPVVTFSATDPINGDALYDIKNDDPWTGSGGGLNVVIGWDTMDLNNTDSGSDPAQPIRLNGIADSVDNGDGTFSITSNTAIPAGATGSGIVYLGGHPVGDLDGDGVFSDRLPVKSVFAYFPITDSEAEPRREIVDINKCDECHGLLSLHGSNRNDAIEVCAVCHNPNATDIEVRPATVDANDDDVFDDPTAVGIDGKREEAIDFKTMIHAIHAGAEEEHGIREKGVVVYGRGGTPHDYSHVRYPRPHNDCEACHVDESYVPPLDMDVLATTVSTWADGSLNPEDDLTMPDDDLNISPTSAVCSSCHDSAVAKTHMEQNGGMFGFTQADIDDADSETCGVCHGSGNIADVEAVHEEH